MHGLVAAPHCSVRRVLDDPVSEHVHQSEVRVVNHSREEVSLAHVLEDDVTLKLLASLLLRSGVPETPGVFRDIELALGNR